MQPRFQRRRRPGFRRYGVAGRSVRHPDRRHPGKPGYRGQSAPGNGYLFSCGAGLLLSVLGRPSFRRLSFSAVLLVLGGIGGCPPLGALFAGRQADNTVMTAHPRRFPGGQAFLGAVCILLAVLLSYGTGRAGGRKPRALWRSPPDPDFFDHGSDAALRRPFIPFVPAPGRRGPRPRSSVDRPAGTASSHKAPRRDEPSPVQREPLRRMGSPSLGGRRGC